ncbi:unnamed protein product [Microthlaspi erraticum]|uniref:FAS1 domain-containing protein n=1 Tax=Microthlaspi erraticum TaxID=1685480 RepID=A0A6D2HYP5_9BRAS|nr:unnamed protein product [Microthlaspi erraticum]
MFIPSDFDAADVSSSKAALIPVVSPSLTTIVPQCLSANDLRLMNLLSRLPTLLRGNTIIVTNNSASYFTLDGVLVSEPDLFLSSSIAIHGVDSSLDFGDDGNGDTTLADSLRPWSHRNRIRYRPEESISKIQKLLFLVEMLWLKLCPQGCLTGLLTRLIAQLVNILTRTT